MKKTGQSYKDNPQTDNEDTEFTFDQIITQIFSKFAKEDREN